MHSKQEEKGNRTSPERKNVMSRGGLIYPVLIIHILSITASVLTGRNV